MIRVNNIEYRTLEEQVQYLTDYVTEQLGVTSGGLKRTLEEQVSWLTEQISPSTPSVGKDLTSVDLYEITGAAPASDGVIYFTSRGKAHYDDGSQSNLIGKTPFKVDTATMSLANNKIGVDTTKVALKTDCKTFSLNGTTLTITDIN